MIMQYLAVSTLLLDQEEEKLEVAMDDQYRYFKTHLAQEKIKIYHRYSEELLMQKLVDLYHLKLSSFCISRWKCQILRMKMKGNAVILSVEPTGISCVHKLKEKMADGRVVELSDVHEQWHLKDVVEVELPKPSEYDMQWNQLCETSKVAATH
ncbi:hypothetical protein PsorP6_005178 [Peronosclerospora sorghi]|uniref:Uncharacterized protein n=1 Tax=Peronosclerospora sorghi TaxID=230839 RepID=A0ACC0W1R4_9STRA|nr:hypothetical protein PsorP6_005178 [Peronosclerospora sorghi]